MPGRRRVSRRALLAGGAALLAGCSAGQRDDRPHESDISAPTTTTQAESVPVLDSTAPSEVPRVDRLQLVSDAHLAAAIETLEDEADALEVLLEETEDVASSESTTATNETTMATNETTTESEGDGDASAVASIREEASTELAHARDLLARLREPTDYDRKRTGDDRFPDHLVVTHDPKAADTWDAVGKTADLRALSWVLDVGYGRRTPADLPAPETLESRVTSVIASLDRRCDGSGRTLRFFHNIEEGLLYAAMTSANLEPPAAAPSGGTRHDDGQTSASGSPAVDLEEVDWYATRAARLDQVLVNVQRQYQTYEAGLQNASPCRDAVAGSLEGLRKRTSDEYTGLTGRPATGTDPPTNVETPVHTAFTTSAYGAAVRDALLPGDAGLEEYYEQIDRYLANELVVHPAVELGLQLLEYRAATTALDWLPTEPVAAGARRDHLTDRFRTAVSRLETTIEAARGQHVALLYLVYAEASLVRAEEDLLEERSQVYHGTYAAIARAYGLCEHAIAVSRLVHGASEPD